MLGVIKCVINDSFVFQQDSAPVHLVSGVQQSPAAAPEYCPIMREVVG